MIRYYAHCYRLKIICQAHNQSDVQDYKTNYDLVKYILLI